MLRVYFVDYLLFICIFYLLCSCQDTKIENSIKQYGIENSYGNKIPIQLDCISDSVKIVKLETTEKCFISNINKIYKNNNLIYIIHDNKCSVFNIEGKYLMDIGRLGNGPGEYIYINKLCFVNNDVWIYDSRKMCFYIYNCNGFYKNNIKLYEYFESLKQITENVVAGLISNDTGDAINRIKFFDSEGSVIDSILNTKLFFNLNFAKSSTLDGSFYKYNEEILFKEGYNDTVFKVLANNQLQANCIINAGKYKFTIEDKFLNKDLKPRKGRMNLVIFENNKYMILRSHPMMPNEYIIINKKKNVANLTSFYYSDDLADNFIKQEEYANIKVGSQEGVKIRISDGSPTFIIHNVSEDGNVLIGTETTVVGNYDDNPTVVLLYMNDLFETEI